jgi:hypothetical protein
MSFTIKQADTAFDRGQYPADAIFFFDFDGVLAEQCEEKVYRLAEVPMERRKLEEQADFAGIDSGLYPDTKYLRHLVYQALAYGTVPKGHAAALQFLEALERNGDPYFIVTARSGLWAVERMIEFCRHEFLNPQEVFCLGRSSKADLLAKLRTDWPDRPFVFIDDTQKHIDACVALADPLLEIVRIDWPTCEINAQALRRQHLGPL